jgi:transketolase
MNNDFSSLAKLVRYYCLVSTSIAGSGHPTSSLSAADLMAVLMFGGFFRFDLHQPEYINNDRLIFSKGHASPLFYALYAVAGQSSPLPNPPHQGEGSKNKFLPLDGGGQGGGGLKRAIDPEELMTLRKFNSRLEGHPTMEFPYTEVPTGSLGQGLSVGVGMALSAKLDNLPYRTYVLLGDSEMAEGSVWEAMQLGAYYKLDNLVAILDVNRLGQRGETMYGWDVEIYRKKCEAFGWEVIVIDGHNFDQIKSAYETATSPQPSPSSAMSSEPNGQEGRERPKMIIAKTVKGKGVSFLEDKDGWHGKALSADELKKALEELGEVDESIIGEISQPERVTSPLPSPISERVPKAGEVKVTDYPKDKLVATRRAYGNALVNIVEAYPNAIVLDAEVSNSTYSEFVKKTHPEKFVECFIAEQNMAGMALGLARRGKIPFVSTFAAFLSRAFDQIRMSQYAKANINPVKSAKGGAAVQPFNGVKFCGSHAGVSIGEDGASQMGLEEIAMFRTLLDSVVLYPCDALSCEKLVWEAAKHQGIVYIQTTRKETPIIYTPPSIPPLDKGGRGGVELVDHDFKIGGSCVLHSSDHDQVTVIGAGITVHEALAAYEQLQKEGINIRVIDLYSVKPLDIATLQKAAQETKAIITVEDSYPEGGIGEAVAGALCNFGVHYILESLAVRKMPHSGKPDELLAYEEIDKNAIIKKIKTLLNTD